ncbi:MAG: TetR/AcrR family transcriptional regulator [Proteobacteria bacterium]|nr:TetR/AcrR family transcriptional regulator [Pseudomonadota bacterium]
MGQETRPTQAAKKIRRPIQKRSRDRKERIVRAAYELFNRDGYQAVTMRRIAAEAGVALGTPHAYFRDKQDLFRAVLSRVYRKMDSAYIREMEEVVARGLELEETVYRLIRVHKQLLESHRILQRDTVVLALSDDGFRDFYLGAEPAAAGRIIDLFFERFESLIEFGDRETARFLLHKGIEETVQYLVFFRPDVDEDRVLRELARMYAGHFQKPPA